MARPTDWLTAFMAMVSYSWLYVRRRPCPPSGGVVVARLRRSRSTGSCGLGKGTPTTTTQRPSASEKLMPSDNLPPTTASSSAPPSLSTHARYAARIPGSPEGVFEKDEAVEEVEDDSQKTHFLT